MRWLSALFVSVTLLVLSLGSARLALAQTSTPPQRPFLARVNATYTVSFDASTAVKLEVRLRNTNSLQYAEQYALQVNSPDVENVRASFANGDSLPVEVTQTSVQTILAVKFPPEKRVVGREQEQLFTLEYSSKDTASRYGEVLEVTLPRLADPEFYEQYNVTLVVPEAFGQPAWVRPEQFTLDKLNGAQVLRFTDVAKSGVSVLFGQSQVYDLGLKYHVSNPSQNAGVVQVALPPDTSWQQVWYESISPAPTSLRTDNDGNWIAEFRLAGQATQTIEAKGQVKVFANPEVSVPVESPFLSESQSWWNRSEQLPWLKSQAYWPLENQLVTAAAKENQSAQSIYDFVVETLQYNSQRARSSTTVERLGAVGALQDPTNALCQEYTDVFIALARASGIPARRVTGYAINQDSALRPLSLVADTLHAWPEYFDVQQGKWIPIDPTWGDTTGGVDYFKRFDLRHITFARQGNSDTLPLAAGQYKVAGSEGQDVHVEIATSSAVPAQAEVIVRVEPVPGVAWAGQPRRLRVLVENKSGLARYNVQVSTEVTGAAVTGEQSWSIPSVLPYQTASTEIALSGPDWFVSTPAQVQITLDDQEAHTIEYGTNVRRTIENSLLRLIALGSVVALVSLGAGSVSILGLRRLRPVRRKSKKS